MKQDKDKGKQLIRNSTAEFLIFTGQAGEQSIEARYEDETIWLTQKLISSLFSVSIPTINEHLKNIFDSGELDPDSVIRKFRITAADGKSYTMEDWAKRLDVFLEFDDREVLHDSGNAAAKLAKAHAESEFEKYRIVQDRLFESDFDRVIKQLEEGKDKETD